MIFIGSAALLLTLPTELIVLPTSSFVHEARRTAANIAKLPELLRQQRIAAGLLPVVVVAALGLCRCHRAGRSRETVSVLVLL